MKQIIFFVILIIFASVVGLGQSLSVSAEEGLIPSWIKTTAGFWINDQVSDSEFISALQFMVENNIIQIPEKSLTPEDKGDFYVTYNLNPNSIHDYSAMNLIADSKYFESNIEYLNGLFALPHDVEIQLMECNVANAFYDWNLKQIIICYEFIDSVYSNFELTHQSEIASGSMTTEDIIIMTKDVMDFAFYHELGHALIDVYDLPITGLEENAADQFSTIFLLVTENQEGYEGVVGQDILYNVGTWFLVQTELYEQSAYWDVHNLDAQRFYNISCYAYGQHPEYNQDLIDDGYLPVERAGNCEYEYGLMAKSWNTLLSKYYKVN